MVKCRLCGKVFAVGGVLWAYFHLFFNLACIHLCGLALKDKYLKNVSCTCASHEQAQLAANMHLGLFGVKAQYPMKHPNLGLSAMAVCSELGKFDVIY